MQDQEVGDGTTSVVIFAAELLQRANTLVRHKIHPTSIISGYRLAMREVRALQQFQKRLGNRLEDEIIIAIILAKVWIWIKDLKKGKLEQFDLLHCFVDDKTELTANA